MSCIKIAYGPARERIKIAYDWHCEGCSRAAHGLLTPQIRHLSKRLHSGPAPGVEPGHPHEHVSRLKTKIS